MRRMIWNAECRTGIEEIDSQHRLLFAISNELLEIDNPLSQEPEIKYLIRHLNDYVKSHFEYEEEWMRKHNYPGFKEHNLKHDKIISEINNVLTTSRTMTEVKNQFETLLDGWIQSHILLEDKKYSDWAKFHKLIK